MKHGQGEGVSNMMKKLLVLAVLAACGSKQTPGNGSSAERTPVAARDTRTPLEKRRDAACEVSADRGTTCAVDDARKRLAANEIDQKTYNDTTKPDLQRALNRDWLNKCEVPLSSFQVRVLEVCNRQAVECDEFHDCVQHINDKQLSPAQK